MESKIGEIADVYPMNDIQKGMVLLSMMNPEGAVYHDQFLYVVPRVKHHDNMVKALQLMIERHPVLRTGFDMDNFSEEVQIVYENVDPVVEFEDISGWEHEQKEQYIKDRMIQDRMKIMDFKRPPLWKINVFHFDEEDSVYLIQFHHAVLDGWSLASFNTQLFNFYHELEKDPAFKPGPLPASFKDIIVEEIAEKENQETIAYWKNKLTGFNRIDIFQNDRIPTPEDGLRRVGIGLEKSRRVKEKAKQEGLHYRNVVFGAFAFAIKMLSLEEDLIIGVVSNNRPAIEGGDEVLGCFLNTLPLRLRYDQLPENTWGAYFKWIDDEMLELKTKDRSTLLEISKIVDRQGAENPFFDILFNHVDFYNVYRGINGSNPMEVFSQKRKLKTRNFEMTNTFLDVMFIDAMDGELLMEYILNKEFKSGLSLDRLHEYICNILDKFLDQGTLHINASDVLPGNERRKLLTEFNATQESEATFTSVLTLFNDWVTKAPEKEILICNDRAYTYRELDELTSKFANYLIQYHHIAAEDLVGIKLQRTEWLVVAILGSWKAGAAYLPMDPAYPEKRIWYMEENSDCKTVLDEATIADFQARQLPGATGFTGKDLRADQLAYMIYTSGSTGKPKGVMIEHGALSNFIEGMSDVLDLTTDDHLLALTSISFDISIFELFWTLSKGIKTTIKTNNGEYYGFDQLMKQHEEVDFSLFYFSSQASDQQDKYELVMDAARFADENDFKAVWLPERHFHEFGGIFPNPSVLAASLATMTKQVNIRSGSVVLPLHDTIRVAEEWSVVDNISGGRVGLSIASGWHVDDFALRPENYKQRHDIMYEQIAELRALWDGQSVKRYNGNAKSISLKAYPRPIQEELPIWITSAGNIDTFRKAGKIGANILTHMLGQDLQSLAEKIAAYREELALNGFDPNKAEVTLMLHTYIGKDLESVQEVVKEPFKNYLRSSIGLIRNLLEGMGAQNTNLEDGEMEDLLEMVFRRYWNTSALFGTVESCRNLVRQIKSIGVTEIGCLIDFGIATEKVLAALPELNRLRETFSSGANTVVADISALTAMQITPSYLSALIEDKDSHAFLQSLKHLMVGGESFPENLKEKVLGITEARVFNMYGPTETTIWSAVQPVTETDINRIGKPIRNTQIYILNKKLELCPLGVVGELYIGGKGLARGYKNNPKATQEKFITSPFNEEERIYNTGDLARWLPDGTLEFFGREDRQVKIRGHRIELAEIEYHLNKHTLIEHSAVIVRTVGDQQELVAYFTSDQPEAPATLRSFLSKHLPAYMIPSRFIQLDSIPTTSNGKLDKKALSNMEVTAAAPVSKPAEEPRSELERALLDIWEEILGQKNIGVKDNFFEIGGNSLNVVRLKRMLKERLDISINIVDLFNYTTIEDITQLVGNGLEMAPDTSSDPVDTLEF